MTDGLKPKHRAAIVAALAAHEKVERAVLFGSRAMQTHSASSDVDIALFGEGLTWTDLAELSAAMDEVPMAQSVDLVLHRSIDNPALLKHIREHGVELKGWQDMVFSEAVQVNPEVRLKRGIAYPFVDMAAVNSNSRSAYALAQREYTSGGSRFLCGDTLMARITPCLENGKVARYCSDNKLSAAHGSTEFIVIRGRNNVTDTSFSYYLTRWKRVRDYAIDQMTGTSGRQRVPIGSLDHLKVPIPPLPEQRAIAHVLGTLDDKIELNRRMNETLEAMARTLFKDWFVDFGPVRAKMEGRDTGLPEDVADLFPDRLVDSELGEIPEGWEVRTLGELIQLNYGKSLRKDKRVPGNFPVYGSGGSETTHAEPLVRHPTVIVGRKGTIGSVFWAPHGCWPIDTTYFAKSELPMTFAYRLLQHLPLTSMNTDAAVPGLNRSNTYRLKVPYSGIKLIHEFAEHSDRLQARIDASEREAELSAYMRDLLLPKLISGEIRLREAEKWFEEVV